jgi:hypothetical protein
MLLIGFSSCSETELISPQDERTTLNNGTIIDNDGNIDGNDNVAGGTLLDTEEGVDEVNTTGAGLFVITQDELDGVNEVTVTGDGRTSADIDVNTVNDQGVITVHNAGNSSVANQPLNTVDGRRIIRSGGASRENNANTISDPLNSAFTSAGSSGADDLTVPNNQTVRYQRTIASDRR